MGPSVSIFGRGELTEHRLAQLDGFFASRASAITRTRKNRQWTLQIQDRPIEVRVENTAEVLWNCEDYLLAAGLLPEDVPYVVDLSAGLNQPADFELLQKLGQSLAVLIGGPATQPTK